MALPIFLQSNYGANSLGQSTGTSGSNTTLKTATGSFASPLTPGSLAVVIAFFSANSSTDLFNPVFRLLNTSGTNLGSPTDSVSWQLINTPSQLGSVAVWFGNGSTLPQSVVVEALWATSGPSVTNPAIEFVCLEFSNYLSYNSIGDTADSSGTVNNPTSHPFSYSAGLGTLILSALQSGGAGTITPMSGFTAGPNGTYTGIEEVQYSLNGASTGYITYTGTTKWWATGNYYYSATTMSITSLNPTSGTIAGGTPVTITGSGFASTSTVYFGATAATSVVVVNATTITCVAPAHVAGAVNVTVIHSGAGTVTAQNAYTYLPPASGFVTGFILGA